MPGKVKFNPYYAYCPYCLSGSYSLSSCVVINVTDNGVAFRCLYHHGSCGLRFDSMKAEEAKKLQVYAEYLEHPGPYRLGSDRFIGNIESSRLKPETYISPFTGKVV